MDDDPDRYRRTDKPALIKKDTYYSILTNNDFDIELRLALLRIFRDKLKSNLAKHKKKAEKKARINAIVSHYGKDGGANIGVNYDESLLDGSQAEEKEKPKKAKMTKSKTTMKVHQDPPSSTRVTSSRDRKNKRSKERKPKEDSNESSSKNALSVSDRKRKGGRTKSTNALPSPGTEEPKKDKKRKPRKGTTVDQPKKDRQKTPRDSKKKSRNNTDDDDDDDGGSSADDRKNKKSKDKKKSKKGGGGGDAFAHLLPSSDVSDWSMGDISKWLMYLSSSPFVPPDDEDSDGDFFDEDELELMAKKKTKLFDKYFQYFVAAQIDGPALLSLNKKTLAKTCKVKNSTDRTLFWIAIQALKSGKVECFVDCCC